MVGMSRACLICVPEAHAWQRKLRRDDKPPAELTWPKLGSDASPFSMVGTDCGAVWVCGHVGLLECVAGPIPADEGT